MVTPNNIKLLDNHHFLRQFVGISPSFRILRDNVWTEEKVDEFRQEFAKYSQWLIEHPEEIPKNIYRDIESVYKGVDKGTMRPDCKLFGSTTTLMPSGEEPLCYKMFTSDVEDVYDVDVYDKCHGCHINLFCEKGCYEQALKNGEPLEHVCSLYKIMFHYILLMDDKMKNNKMWQDITRSAIEWD